MQNTKGMLYDICKWLTRLVHGKNAHERDVEALFQFAKFGIVGISNTLISYLLNIAVLRLLTPLAVAWDYVAGNVVAFILSVLWSFYWNKRFVFEKGKMSVRDTLRMMLKTYAAYVFTGIFLSTLLSWLWIEKVGISKFIAPLINLIVSVPVNFIINKFWTFA